jgi:hypothetical protein
MLYKFRLCALVREGLYGVVTVVKRKRGRKLFLVSVDDGGMMIGEGQYTLP